MVAIRVAFRYHRNNDYGNEACKKDAGCIETLWEKSQRLECEKYGKYS